MTEVWRLKRDSGLSSTCNGKSPVELTGLHFYRWFQYLSYI
jgi:hypothetical protein